MASNTTYTIMTEDCTTSVPNSDSVYNLNVDKISIVSFNLHGLNQGKLAIHEIIDSHMPDIILIQEHWLTPANLYKLDEFDGYYAFGSSAMNTVVAQGPIYGRPFGGVGALIKNSLRGHCETIHAGERFLVLKMFNYIIMNVYLPCDGTSDRLHLCEYLLNEILFWREQFTNCNYILAGDLNVELGSLDAIDKCISEHRLHCNLFNCFDLYPNYKFISYVNEALGHSSLIDYFLCDNAQAVLDICILDADDNFSDHMPVKAVFQVSKPIEKVTTPDISTSHYASFDITLLRWDHADIVSYYEFCRAKLQTILDDVNYAYDNRASLPFDSASSIIDNIYNFIVQTLTTADNLFVPHLRKNSLKFWWDAEMSRLKEESVNSDRIWKSIGRPRSGPIFQRRQACRSAYRHQLRRNEKDYANFYSNALHESLLSKDTHTFWRCWQSKFDHKSKRLTIENTTDRSGLVGKFANYFSSLVQPTSVERATDLEREFADKFCSYVGNVCDPDDLFNVELVDDALGKLKLGKAHDLDGLNAEQDDT